VVRFIAFDPNAIVLSPVANKSISTYNNKQHATIALMQVTRCRGADGDELIASIPAIGNKFYVTKFIHTDNNVYIISGSQYSSYNVLNLNTGEYRSMLRPAATSASIEFRHWKIATAFFCKQDEQPVIDTRNIPVSMTRLSIDGNIIIFSDSWIVYVWDITNIADPLLVSVHPLPNLKSVNRIVFTDENMTHIFIDGHDLYKPIQYRFIASIFGDEIKEISSIHLYNQDHRK
jgi:hypothetical protein